MSRTPQVTPLFNVMGGPGALVRYRREGQLFSPLAWQLVTGTVPGVIVGAVIRVASIGKPAPASSSTERGGED